jgi:hypothetical protein
MTGLCLGLAFSLVQAHVSGDEFALVWRHSVEHTQWVEHYHVTPTGLELVEATIDGSGAGMDPPAGAVLRDGRWHYRPRLPPQRRLTLIRSGYTDDYRICQRQRCQSFTELLGPPISTGEHVDLFPCELRSR